LKGNLLLPNFLFGGPLDIITANNQNKDERSEKIKIGVQQSRQIFTSG